MTRQAVSKHLAEMKEANLVAAVPQGRRKLHDLNPPPIAEVAAPLDPQVRAPARARPDGG